MVSRRVAIYCGYVTEREKRAASEKLCDVAKEQGWTVAAVFADGKERLGANPSPEWRRLRSFIETGKADVVATPSLAAIGATVSDVFAEILWLRDQHCDLYVHDVGLNTVSPIDQVLFRIVEALKVVDDTSVRKSDTTEFRQRRPKARQPVLSPYQRAVIRAAISSGLNLQQVAKSLKLSVATVRTFAKSQKP